MRKCSARWPFSCYLVQRIKRFVFYSLILAAPFFCLIIVNEASRSEPYHVSVFGKSEPSINPQQRDAKRCTWDCHTNECSHREKNCINVGIINVLYQNIITSLQIKEGGDVYQQMNVLLFWYHLAFQLRPFY